jgi:hypothetical protein
MKIRYLAIVIAITALLLLAGCAKKAAPAPSTPTAPSAPSTPAATPAAEAPATETAAETEMTEEVTTEEDAIASAPVVEAGEDATDATEEVKGGQGLAVDLTSKNEVFTDATCDLKELDGKQMRVITATLKNIESDEWIIYGKENPKGKVRIGNRGVIDITPGCDKTTLASGDEAVCKTVDNGAVISGENRVTVNTPLAQYARVVMCP